jgi:hypothetical protein
MQKSSTSLPQYFKHYESEFGYLNNPDHERFPHIPTALKPSVT